MRIVILSIHSGSSERGVETWAANLQKHLEEEVVVVFGNYFLKMKVWLNADIVVPTNGRFQVFVVRLITWILGKPMVVFGHSGPGADDKWNLLCMPNVFVSFSEAQKKWADKFKLGFTKSIVINHAVDIHLFKPRKSKHKKQTVLCVAANSPNKRVDLVRDAVERLKEVQFRIVGRGQAEEVEHHKMPEVYSGADVFCFVPESWEAFGLVYLEALSCNLPVVTINDPVRKEIVGDAGVLVDDPENTESLLKAIKKALSTDWGNKPRKQAEKFSWNKTGEKYSKLFESLT